jgi:hypothetical protein
MKYIKLFENWNESENGRSNLKENILFPLSTGGNKTLILLPGSGADGGQGKDDFDQLAKSLGEEFSVYTANFTNELDVRKYAEDIANEIKNNPNITDFAVGGFSIGGAMAWHLARILKDLKVDKFVNKLFFIDSGISDSTDKFIEDMIAGNTPRVAIVQPLNVFIKNRNGENLTPDEETQIKNFYKDSDLKDFKIKNKGNYLEYIGNKFPPADVEIENQAKKINQKDPWIIEDKYDTTNFKKRYSVKPEQIKGKTFKEGDPIDYKVFAERDTKKKMGLNRELPGGKKLGPLIGVEIISLIASDKKEGKKSPEEIEAAKKETENATSGTADVIVVDGATHNTITKSPNLSKIISSKF